MASTLADRNSLPRRLTSRRRRRRGLVLLMVVSLLALFLLMGVTFAILAIQYKNSAETQAQLERYGDPPMQEMGLAIGQLMYGSVNRSSLQGHELLRDVYGGDHIQGTVSGVTPAGDAKTCSNQFQVFTFNSTSNKSQAPGFYNGRVLTFITGNAAGYSTRVAGYSSTASELYVETIRVNGTSAVTLNNNDEFVINGQPFNGMGFGYDPYTLQIDAVGANSINQPVALMPHYAGYTDRYAVSSSGIAPAGTQFSPDAGGADEPYDAPDLNNMAMAFVPADMFATTGRPLLPSFHRPELVNYWLAHWPGGGTPTLKNDSTGQQKNFIRQVIFRPMPWDHHNFTGGNPKLTLPNSYSSSATTDAHCEDLLKLLAQQAGWNPDVWDVDNDGDGLRDSIWVDIGLPAMTSPSGRRYKRLFAFLVKDLDGRANVNVHGNWKQSDARNRATTANLQHPFPAFAGTSVPASVYFPMGVSGGGAMSSATFPRGLGFGPAEVDIQQVIGTTYFNNLLNARYGGDGQPGIGNTDDSLSVVKFSGIPRNYVPLTDPGMMGPQFPGDGSWYASPPDVWGRGAIAVDFGGKPVHFRMGNADETLDDPYEIEWDEATSRNDSPFGIGDMEITLRANDHDVRYFPTRIGAALPDLTVGVGDPRTSNGAYHQLRESITTMSNSIPSPSAIPSYEERERLRAALQSSLSVNQATASQRMTEAEYAPTPYILFAQRLIHGGVTAANVPNEMAKMFPIEFWQGSKLNINRYLGNGINDNQATTDGIHKLIDEPAESQTFSPLETVWGNGTTPAPNPPSGGVLPANFSNQRAYPVNSVDVGSSRVDLQACKLEYSIVSPK